MHSQLTPATNNLLRVSLFAASLLVGALVLPYSGLAQPTVIEVLEQQSEEEIGAESIPEDLLKKIPEDPLNRGVPRSSVRGFLVATNERDFERAANFLDLSNLPRGYSAKEGALLARQLKVVLDRTLWIDLDLLSLNPEGKTEDGLPRNRDRVGKIKSKKKIYDLWIQRIPREDGVLIWKFSASTVAKIPVLYTRFGYGVLGDILPPRFFDTQIIGIPIAYVIVALGLIAIYYFLLLAILKGLLLFLRTRGFPPTPKLQRLLTRPLLLLIVVYASRETVLGLLGTTMAAQALARANTLVLFLLAWTLISAIDVAFDNVRERLKRKGQTTGLFLFPPLINGIRIFVVIALFLLWFDNLGFEVTTVIAGLGIGGLAVALAAQKPIENFFSGIILYSAQPVRIGDLCRFGTTLGTVEEINLRATRVRTLDHTLVSVPNSEFVNSQIENVSEREKIRYHPRLRIQYESSADQIRYILVEIRKLLYSHPKVLTDPARVRFADIGACSFELDIFAYIAVTDYGEYLEVAEDLNLRIVEIVQKAGGRFALPNSQSYREQAQDVDDQRVRESEARVREWRGNNTLYIPSFPPDKIRELKGSLDFPPIGSSQAAS